MKARMNAPKNARRITDLQGGIHLLEKIVTVPNRLGIHARPAALLVRKASGFRSEITICLGEDEVNGKSIMGVMTLAAGKGTEILVRASGIDEEEALEVICKLISSGFGEE